jgi:tRNA(fMet)-specific endonuclease VapC
MIHLDTDHATLLKYPGGDRGERLVGRLRAASAAEGIAVSIITVEGQMRGWLAAIAKERKASIQVIDYRELGELSNYSRAFTIAPFDDAAAGRFESLRTARLRLGTMGLKIAAVALAQGSLLLSANGSDFERVPGLRVENWAD